MKVAVTKRPPASWIRKNVLVNYHSRIGGPVTIPNCVVQEDPFQASSGAWVTYIDMVRGYVACAALTPYGEPKR